MASAHARVARVSAVAGSAGAHTIGPSLWGLRAFGSVRFRTVLALVLASIGLVAHIFLARQLAAIGYGAGHDFTSYFSAGQIVAAGGSPYLLSTGLAEQGAACLGCYLYPPTIAYAVLPLVGLGATAASVAWTAIQLAAMWLALWIGAGIGGARRSAERALWCLAAAVLFTPVFATLFYGNVSALIALGAALVALGGRTAGASGAVMALVKVAPVTFLPAVLAMGDASRRGLLFGFAAVLGLGLLLGPGAWRESIDVLLTLAASEPAAAQNMAPAAVAAQLDLPATMVFGARTASLLMVAIAVSISVVAARRPGGAPAAALAGAIAMLLLPATTWFHYLAVLLPFAAMAWPPSSFTVRTALLAGSLITSAGLLSPPLALVGAATVALTCSWVLWPARTELATPVPPGADDAGLQLSART